MAPTTSPPSAASAVPRFSATGTTAPQLARARVVSVEPVGLAEVFNLTVEDVPEFFANGILVHNCDAARYSYADLHHFLAKERVPPPPPGSAAAYAAEAAAHERQIDDARKRADAYADTITGGYNYGGYE